MVFFFLKTIKDNEPYKMPEDYILNKYFSKPFLINGHKFDMRYFALITGLSPLRIYFYNEGLIKIAAGVYKVNKETIDDYSIHLTNVHFSQHLKGYRKAKHKKDFDSYLWTLGMFEKFVEAKGYDYKKMKEKIIHMILLSIFSVQHKYSKSFKEMGYNNNNFYQLLGYDITIDENFEKPYIYEINRGEPSWDISEFFNQEIYYDLYAEILNIVGIVPFSHGKENKPMDMVKDYNDPIEEAVDNAICEFCRPMGGFTRIFPLRDNIDKYEKYILDKNDFPENERLWKKMKELEIE